MSFYPDSDRADMIAGSGRRVRLDCIALILGERCLHYY